MNSFKKGDIIKCLKGHGRDKESITYGKLYEVINISGVNSDYVMIVNDYGHNGLYSHHIFELDIQIMRNDVINEILS